MDQSARPSVHDLCEVNAVMTAKLVELQNTNAELEAERLVLRAERRSATTDC